MQNLLFSSPHSLLDPASGAAVSTRDLLHLLTGRGWSCAALCGVRCDSAQASPTQLLANHPLPFPVDLFDGLSASPAPREEGQAFLHRFEETLDRFRPDVVLTYGGDWVVWELAKRARARGVRVVFGLHNLAYRDAGPFAAIDAILVPSEFARDHYQRTLGLETTALPGPWSWERARCEQVEGKYLTFVNPILAKGLLLAARIIHEVGRRRPDIPFLVVEGRGRAANLGKTGLDLGQANLRVLANTADPREFYRLSKVVLLPSVCDDWRPERLLPRFEEILRGPGRNGRPSG